MHKILIADDHPLILRGIIAEFQYLSHFPIIIQADNGESALKCILDDKPSVAILDLQMPKLNGLQVLEVISKQSIQTKVIILTMFKDLQLYDKAMKLGARGYLLKDTVLEELKNCLEVIVSGKIYTSPVMDSLIKSEADFHPDLISLTRMESKIFKLIKASKTTKQIAEELYLSDKTIENHRYNISKKLNLPPEKNAILKYILKMGNNKSKI